MSLFLFRHGSSYSMNQDVNMTVYYMDANILKSIQMVGSSGLSELHLVYSLQQLVIRNLPD